MKKINTTRRKIKKISTNRQGDIQHQGEVKHNAAPTFFQYHHISIYLFIHIKMANIRIVSCVQIER